MRVAVAGDEEALMAEHSKNVFENILFYRRIRSTLNDNTALEQDGWSEQLGAVMTVQQVPSSQVKDRRTVERKML